MTKPPENRGNEGYDGQGAHDHGEPLPFDEAVKRIIEQRRKSREEDEERERRGEYIIKG